MHLYHALLESRWLYGNSDFRRIPGMPPRIERNPNHDQRYVWRIESPHYLIARIDMPSYYVFVGADLFQPRSHRWIVLMSLDSEPDNVVEHDHAKHSRSLGELCFDLKKEYRLDSGWEPAYQFTFGF
jgi:hypothetical protein